MAHILIAEDDEFLREILSDYLTEKGHKVDVTPNGRAAKEIVLTGGFDLVVSDVQMPFINGVELLQWLRTQSKMPFILMTGFTNLLETQRAAELGAQGFLTKPFSNQDLLKMIDAALAPVHEISEAERLNIESSYCRVPIDEFVARPQIEFDLFVRLPGSRFLRIAYKGETLDIARLRNYAVKGVTHLHVLKEDFSKLVNFNIHVARALGNSQAVSDEKKARFVRYTAESVMEKCYVHNMNRESFDEARSFVTATLDMITESPKLLDLMAIMSEHSDRLYIHCLGVAVYSVMIGKRLNYNSSQTYFKLALAGLLHDIGKKELDRELLDKPRALMNVQERKLYESHAERGRDLLRALGTVPDDVLQIIHEHHEDEREQGYPCQTPHLKLHPLSRIVYVADLFMTLALRSVNSDGMNAIGALTHIEKYEIERVNRTIFTALRALLSPETKVA